MKKIILTILSLCLAIGLMSEMGVEKVHAATEECETENNDTKETANTISDNEQMKGAITAGDVDFYKYTVFGTGYFNLNFSLDYDYYVYYDVAIYDSNLNKIDEEIKVSSFSRRFNFKEGTEWYISVSGNKVYNYSEKGNYYLDLTFTSKSNWEIESNNTKKTATKLSGKKKGTLYTIDDVDYYKYTASKNGYVKFSFGDEENFLEKVQKGEAYGGWCVSAYNSKMKKIGVWDGICGSFPLGNFWVKKGEVIYLKIEKMEEYSWYPEFKGRVTDKVYSITPTFKTVTYREKENNNSLSKANKIKLNKTYHGIFSWVEKSSGEEYKDSDWYKFKATSNGTYKIDINIKPLAWHSYSGYGYWIAVCDSSKKIIAYQSASWAETLKFKVKKGKTYYIEVCNHASQSRDYFYNFKVKK